MYVMSHALRSACFKGRVDVDHWLIMKTTAYVSLRGEMNTEYGTMTSLAVACHRSHVDIVVKASVWTRLLILLLVIQDQILHKVLTFMMLV